MMMAIRGPAAASATAYINRLWEWTCGDRTSNWLATTGSWVYPSGEGCLSPLHPPAADSPGDLDMLEVGGLGVGIQAKDDSSTYRLPDVKQPQDAKCDKNFADKDVVNLDRDYQTVNPEETALRAMVATAQHSIVFSQQDLYGWCATISWPIKAVQPLGDLRLLDNLATKMIQGVKVRIVVSTPGNEDSYSTMSNMRQFWTCYASGSRCRRAITARPGRSWRTPFSTPRCAAATSPTGGARRRTPRARSSTATTRRSPARTASTPS